jgi:zona occludens toxin
MINILIGPPGGGKSYEAVVYHVLPALANGRKVITNLPLQMNRIAAIDATYVPLVEIRLKTLGTKKEVDWEKAEKLHSKFGIVSKTEFFSERAFANPEDYADTWRHPVSGSAPLYVIDECHLALPRGGTKRLVEEWFSLHRHESADVLLMTQSYGKVSQSIIELVQLCYKVRKGTAFGTSKRYIRKVQDGIRGDVVNTAVREYQKQYFSLYLSHTRGGGAELAAQDVVPMWKRWPFIGTGIAVVVLIAMIPFLKNPLAVNVKPSQAIVPAPMRKGDEIKQASAVVAEKRLAVDEQKADSSLPMEPYGGKGFHYQGKLSIGSKLMHVFGVSQNAQLIGSVTSEELELAGYRVKITGSCTGWVYYGKTERPVVCDSPAVSVGGISAVRRGPTEGPPAGGGAVVPERRNTAL